MSTRVVMEISTEEGSTRKEMYTEGHYGGYTWDEIMDSVVDWLRGAGYIIEREDVNMYMQDRMPFTQLEELAFDLDPPQEVEAAPDDK